MRSRLLTFAVPAAALTLLLAGCVPSPESDAAPTARPTPSATASPTPSATVAPSDAATPITIGCDALVSAQTMLDYNPNYTLKADYSPAPGSLGAQAVAAKGIACAWVHGSNGSLIEVSAADLPQAQYDAIMNELVSTSNPVPTYGVEGYFRADGGVGVAQAGSGRFWVVASSTAFFEPGDATPIMTAALGALG